MLSPCLRSCICMTCVIVFDLKFYVFDFHCTPKNFLLLKLSHIIATIVNPCHVLCYRSSVATIVMILCVKVMIWWKTIKGRSKRTNEEPKLEVDIKRYRSRFNDILYLRVHGKWVFRVLIKFYSVCLYVENQNLWMKIKCSCRLTIVT